MDTTSKEDDIKSQILASKIEVQNIDQELTTTKSEIDRLLAQQWSLQAKKKTLEKRIMQLQHKLSTKDEKWDTTFPWSEKLVSLLKEHFGLDTFRPLQRETMNVTLSNKDCILIMPTGGGKSLCFQLPALVYKGFTLVVSPLLSLMEDQLNALGKSNIEAAMISSTLRGKQVTAILSRLTEKNCTLKIMYVTPEKIAKSKQFMSKLEKADKMGNLSRIVIDEVHCASQWGHDFRPDYKILGILKRQFPNVPLLGLTATASEKVLDDVKDILSLDEACTVFRSSFNRPNLYYEVVHTSMDQRALVNEIALRITAEFSDMSGIIYCFSRNDSEFVAEQLAQKGILAHCYHAYLEPETKTSVHNSWTEGNLKVIVATVAFGMGIDKPEVRFVIHYSISKSIENYYQESGRAGRDGQKATCILYFRFQDVTRQSSMVFTEKNGLQNLYDMLKYSIDPTNCRRTLIGDHFGERWTSDKCNKMCDNCFFKREGVKGKDLYGDAEVLISILRMAKSSEVRLTPGKLIELWMGKGKLSLRPSEPTKHTREDCELIVTKLLVESVLTEEFHFTPYSTITYIIAGKRWPLLKNRQMILTIQLGF